MKLADVDHYDQSFHALENIWKNEFILNSNVFNSKIWISINFKNLV